MSARRALRLHVHRPPSDGGCGRHRQARSCRNRCRPRPSDPHPDADDQRRRSRLADEAERIAPLLDAIVGASGVAEVIVVDDQSSDATAEIARLAGASVVSGAPLPDGWAGKAWALQQGIEAATSDWVVTLDADARPDPQLPTALVARAVGDASTC